MTTTVSRLSIHQEHELLLRLERAGISPDDAQRVIASRGNRVASNWLAQLRDAGTVTGAGGTLIGSHTVNIDRRTVEEMGVAGGYDFLDSRITSVNFPRQRPTESAVIELVEFGKDVTTDEAETGLAARGLLLPVMEHQLAVGEQHPDLQRERPIVFLGAAYVRPDGRRGVGVLDGGASDRDCGLSWVGPDRRWSPVCVFAGVRKP